MKLIDNTGRQFLPQMVAEVATGNVIWVSASNGSDTFGLAGRLDRPFATLTAAKTAASSGTTIIVLPGTYTDSDIAKNGVNWHFLIGAVVNRASGTSNAIFEVGSGMTFKVTGDGDFTNTASGTTSYFINVTAGSSTIDIRCRAIVSNSSCIRVAVSSIVKVTADSITSNNAGSAVEVSGSGTVEVRANTLDGYSSDAVYVTAGTALIVADAISSFAGRGVRVTGGTLTVTAREIRSNQNHGLEYGGGDVTVNGSRIVTTWSSTTSRAVYVSGGPTSGAATFRLVRCILIAKAGVSTASIEGVTPARPVGFYAECVVNIGVGNFITGQIYPTLKADTNVN